jgi:hypothetical protein
MKVSRAEDKLSLKQICLTYKVLTNSSCFRRSAGHIVLGQVEPCLFWMVLMYDDFSIFYLSQDVFFLVRKHGHVTDLCVTVRQFSEFVGTVFTSTVNRNPLVMYVPYTVS